MDGHGTICDTTTQCKLFSLCSNAVRIAVAACLYLCLYHFLLQYNAEWWYGKGGVCAFLDRTSSPIILNFGQCENTIKKKN
eukprot:8417805-Ditylum_brightwellii.AAC.1